MSHPPFTLEYMQEGEMLSSQIDEDDRKQQENHQESMEDKSQTNSRPDQDPGEEQLDAMEQVKDKMNIRIIDNEEMSFFKILRMAMRRRIEIFAEEVSIVGLSHLLQPSSNKIGSIIRKVTWTMLLLFGVGFMVFQIYDRISYYLTYPTIVDYRVAYNRSLRFPTVTICPEFFLSRKAMLSLGPQTQSFANLRFPPFTDTEFGEDYRTKNFSQLDFDWEFFFSYMSIKTEDMMLECSFGNRPCSSSVAIKSLRTDLGDCFCFNADTANYVTTRPEANDGLRLVLWFNQSDGYIMMSPAAGFRVFLHAPWELPIMQSFAFRVGTGISTSVSFSLRNVSMLPSPYGDCRQAENYTFMRCMAACVNTAMLSYCKCRPLHIDGPGPPCPPDQYYFCVSNVKRWLVLSGEINKCNCPLKCHQPTYPYSISTSPLSQHFLNYTSRRSQFKGRNLTMSKLSKELAYLDIFYSQLSYIDIQTTPAYDLLALICDIGGALGLILGGTILTIFELLQFFVQLFDELITSAMFANMHRR